MTKHECSDVYWRDRCHPSLRHSCFVIPSCLGISCFVILPTRLGIRASSFFLHGFDHEVIDFDRDTVLDEFHRDKQPPLATSTLRDDTLKPVHRPVLDPHSAPCAPSAFNGQRCVQFDQMIQMLQVVAEPPLIGNCVSTVETRLVVSACTRSSSHPNMKT